MAANLLFIQEKKEIDKIQTYAIADFYSSKPDLDTKVNEVYSKLAMEERVAQMIMPAAGRLGKPDSVIIDLINKKLVGGILLLNGSKEDFKSRIKQYNQLNKNLGLFYSADAEPSLINRKISGTVPVPKTAELITKEKNIEVAGTISKELNDMGINVNFAPVVDLSTSNQAITNRSYSNSSNSVVERAKEFITVSNQHQILTTIKHFPGHGLVNGDSHHNLVYIDKEFKELDVYKKLLGGNIYGVMVGHIAIENIDGYNTDGMPATCAPNIVKGLLRNELNFKGIIVTDALNMGAVSSIQNNALLAAEAGCDILLMPDNEKATIHAIINKMGTDKEFASQVEASVKRIIRMKLCLGIIH